MKNALVCYADGSEDIEVTASADILSRAGVKVTKAAIKDNGLDVVLAHGTHVTCDININDVNTNFDLVVVPGGMPGSTNCADSQKLISILKDQVASKRLIGAICAAPGFVLHAKGILNGRKATVYPGCECGGSFTSNGVEVSDDGLVITGKGPNFAIAFGLELVKHLVGDDMCLQVGKGMLVF